jgi:cytochrome P450
MHRQPDVWEDPEAFRPERFAKENRIKREGFFDYVPFSAGPRKYADSQRACILTTT